MSVDQARELAKLERQIASLTARLLALRARRAELVAALAKE